MRSTAAGIRLTVVPTLALAAALLALPAGLGGCQSDPNDVSFDAIKGNATPEMNTLVETVPDVDRNIAMNWNQNLRNAAMDWGRAWYWDSPSRLSPYSMIPTGGTLK